MTGFLCDLMAHAEWANAVFFQAWGDSPARELEEMRRRTGHIVGVQHGFPVSLTRRKPGNSSGRCARQHLRTSRAVP